MTRQLEAILSTRFAQRRLAATVAVAAIALGITVTATTVASAATAPSAAAASASSPRPVVQPDVAGVAQPPDPAVAAKVAAWVAHGGEQRLTNLSRDFGSLVQAANTTNMANMGASCTQLRTDVASAQAYAPIPDAQAQVQWAAALTAYARGAADCVAGTGASSATLITRAADEIVAGSASLKLVTERLNQIAGH